ncbi:cytochrome b/b6 domain-containing protein [Alteromonas sp. CI.11.F.A3]|uniref:cytochrome b/b6 domain-containing protein n=1 Tax=Alteromonas sp. CI.11.F.A3 TaxID=3079555 RepID=UPI0029434019|nr:cytochrome b/b6 domain-containing protein [Alteromonas sp. CI.11.F.A3]WOI36234.1 cytochrome b/b6 domain-containing protein [Alteromonas sp. CI.11.F.A3]
MRQQLIWDLPTRLFHWLLVASIAAQYVTAEWMDDATQGHFYIGYFTLGLLVFRLVWGFIGPTYARFSQFVKGPSAVIGYLRTLLDKNSVAVAGHNPLGGWFVVVMLLLLLVQAVSGLFMTDDIFLDGPYRHLVSGSTLDLMNTLHHLAFEILLWVIGLHVAAIGFYAVYKKQKLVPPMFHGKKDTNDKPIPSSRLWLALAIALVTAAALYYAIEVAPPTPEVEEYF